ncbi:hypothetical protein L208DRAFT_1379025 [Tricholoma matsutake]|nr:hypothetical protein L208DRAFT_1379025 [Tricholoma matsutake 945]
MQQGTGTSCLSGGHHSWDMFLDQKSSRDPSSANFSTAITTALLRHGNTTYTRLNKLYIQAKYELEAQKPMIPAAIARAPTSQVDTTSLTIPKCPDPYDADDYPDVCWHENDWILHGEKQWNGGNTVSKLDFLTDHDGHTLSEKCIKVITDSARQAWMQLYYHRLDPTSWKKKAEDTKQYFNAVMKAEFPEFRYHEGARPSKRSSDDVAASSSGQRKKIKVRSALLPDTDIIDLEGEPTTIPSNVMTNTPMSTTSKAESAIPSELIAQLLPSSSITTPSTILSSETTTSHSPSSPAIPLSTPTPVGPTPCSTVTPMSATSHATPESATTPAAQAVDGAIALIGQSIGLNAIGSAGLVIHKPSIEVAAISTTTSDSDTSAKKTGKSIKASKMSLTARNLFLIDYLKDHSDPTQAMYKFGSCDILPTSSNFLIPQADADVSIRVTEF